MVFSSTIIVENNTSPFEQGNKFLFGAQAPFMASNNSPAAAAPTTTSSASATTYTHAIFEPQQQSFQQIHHHHHQQQQQQQQLQQQNDGDDNNNHHQISFGMIPSASSSSAAIHGNFLNIKDSGGAYDLGELDQALFLYLDSQEQSTAQEQRQNSGMRPHTLNIFPSQPMHVEPSSSTPAAAATRASTGTVSPATSGSKRSSEPSMELSNPRNDAPQPAKAVKREGNRKGATSNAEQEGPKTPDPKALRRLAQNREAARKSRLRKKAYVQQLESSRIRLTQLEQEIQRARSQGIFLGGGSVLGGEQGQVPLAMGNINSVFDMEYARWVDEHQRLMVELRNAVQDHLPENDLRIYVGNCLAHYDQLMNLKSMIIKSDVFHIFSGMWKTPAERCFMWIGGFRPSEIIKIISSQVEPLTEQQLMGICGLQQSTHEAEEALSQGLEALNQSLNEILISDPLNLPPDVNTFMSTMALAINKLSTLEGFVRQADHLRHQTLHRLHQLLTTRQSGRCFLAMAEYFHRLRALSSLWLARPRQD